MAADRMVTNFCVQCENYCRQIANLETEATWLEQHLVEAELKIETLEEALRRQQDATP